MLKHKSRSIWLWQLAPHLERLFLFKAYTQLSYIRRRPLNNLGGKLGNTISYQVPDVVPRRCLRCLLKSCSKSRRVGTDVECLFTEVLGYQSDSVTCRTALLWMTSSFCPTGQMVPCRVCVCEDYNKWISRPISLTWLKNPHIQQEPVINISTINSSSCTLVAHVNYILLILKTGYNFNTGMKCLALLSQSLRFISN